MASYPDKEEILQRTGHRLFARRQIAQIPRSKLASDVDMPPSNVVKYESGLVDFPLSRLARFASALNCSIASLVGDAPLFPEFTAETVAGLMRMLHTGSGRSMIFSALGEEMKRSLSPEEYKALMETYLPVNIL